MSATRSALESDALEAALPVRKPVENNDDIVGSFDNGTTYDKDSSVIVMYEAWLGPERFRDVIRGYLREHAWKVATMEDFLADLSQSAGPEVARSFGGFIVQKGAPRITAQLSCPAGGAPTVKLSQERYLPVGSKADAKQEWQVPVSLRVGTGTQSSRVCSMLQGPSADVDAAVERGDLPLGEALKAVPASAKSTNRLVVQSGASLLGQVPVDQLTQEERQRFRAWVASLYSARARAMGWVPKPGEDDSVKESRSLFLQLAGGTGDDPQLAKEALTLVRAWLADRKSVDPEAFGSALPRAAAHGDVALFDALLEAAKKEQDRSERSRLLTSLAYFRNPDLLWRALGLVVSPDFDGRDSQVILGMALMSPESQALAWNFYQTHFDALSQRLRSDELGRLIGQTGNRCNEIDLAQVETFLTPRVDKIEGGPRALARALESIRLCIKAQEVHAPSVKAFLRTR